MLPRWKTLFMARAAIGPASRRGFHQRPGNHPLLAAIRQHHRKQPAKADELEREPLLAKLEAYLFLADEPFTAKKLADLTGLGSVAKIREQVERLNTLYQSDESAFQIVELAGGYQLLTRPCYYPWLIRLQHTGDKIGLTPSNLETLAVIAYKQPITRADIEAIRGVVCSDGIRLLMEKGLIRIAGRHPSLGRPQLYATTKRFLQMFGLNSVEDLPAIGQ